jgi:hypothetical protein
MHGARKTAENKNSWQYQADAVVRGRKSHKRALRLTRMSFPARQSADRER